jgi:hypothetical protein
LGGRDLELLEIEGGHRRVPNLPAGFDEGVIVDDGGGEPALREGGREGRREGGEGG